MKQKIFNSVFLVLILIFYCAFGLSFFRKDSIKDSNKDFLACNTPEKFTALHEASHAFMYFKTCKLYGYKFRPKKMTIVPVQGEYGSFIVDKDSSISDENRCRYYLAGMVGRLCYSNLGFKLTEMDISSIPVPSKIDNAYEVDYVKASALITNDSVYLNIIKSLPAFLDRNKIEKIAMVLYREKTITNFKEVEKICNE